MRVEVWYWLLNAINWAAAGLGPGPGLITKDVMSMVTPRKPQSAVRIRRGVILGAHEMRDQARHLPVPVELR
jgi:hypothetical protein